MSRSHPPTLLTITQRTIDHELRLGAGDVVLVAVSGGPDSMALLHVLAKVLPPRRVHVVAHGVDHGLRPAAREELAQAGQLANELGVPFATTEVLVPPGANLMARARDARYAALRAALARSTHPVHTTHPTHSGGAARGEHRYIATGHHADDRAETALIRLLRGSGPAGLAVLPAASADLVRPFIRARRDDVLAHVARHRLPSSNDPTNSDTRFLRSRVRHELLPLLAELSPRVVDHLCGLADALGDLAARAAVAGEDDDDLEAAGELAERRRSLDIKAPAAIEGLKLGRAQRQALEDAFRTRNTQARVPLRGGAIARVDLTTSKIVLTKAK